MVVYGDAVLMLNLLINYTLLRGSARLGACAPRQLRLWLGAALGAVYALLTYIPGFGFLHSFLAKLLTAGLMLSCAFGWKRSTFRLGGIFAFLSLVLCGAVYCVHTLQGTPMGSEGYLLYPVSFSALLLTAFAVCLACRMLLPTLQHADKSLLPLSISLKGKTIHLTALRDTGNTLTDPLSGAPVLTVYWKALRPLLPKGLDEAALQSPSEALASHRTLSPRLIPYRAVGTKRGLLFAIPCTVSTEHKTQTQLVALSPTPVSDGGAYEALIGGTTHV